MLCLGLSTTHADFSPKIHFGDQDTMALKKWYFYEARVSCKLQDDIVY